MVQLHQQIIKQLMKFYKKSPSNNLKRIINQLKTNKYKLDYNIEVKNFNDAPSPYGYFYNINKNFSKKYLILINASNNDLNSYLIRNNYKILEKLEKCYLVRFND